jgi:hypothetical protein
MEAMGLVDVDLPFWCSLHIVNKKMTSAFSRDSDKCIALPVVACNSSVGGFRLDGLAIRADKNRCHQAKRSITLSNNIRLDITIVVLAGPDEAT